MVQSILGVGKLLVISPHLDDAVFAFGDPLLACPGTVIATPGRPGAADAREPERHGALVSDGEPP